MAFIVPPGGFKGFAQMTPASQRALGGRAGTRTARPGRRRRSNGSAAKQSTRARVVRAGGKSKGRKMKFGSPAWQKKYKVGKYRK